MKKKLFFLMYILMILLIAVGCAGSSFPEPDEIIELFIQHWNSEEYESMYQLLTDEAKTIHDENTFISRYNNISSGIGLKAITIHEVEVGEIVDEQVTVSYTLEFETSTVERFSHHYQATLHKGEESWFLAWDHNLVFPDLEAAYAARVTRHFPQRGSILDRNNKPLAYSGTVREIGVVPGKIGDENFLLNSLASLLELSPEAIEKAYTQSWVMPEMYVPIKKISEAYWQEKSEQFLALQGVMIKQVQGRVYDVPPTLGQTVGYLSEITKEKLEDLRPLGYRAGDYIGFTGLEAAYETTLAGTIGFAITIYDAANNAAATVAETAVVDGEDLITTLDSDLQFVTDKVLAEQTGSVIILDSISGEVLTMGSNPGYDSNLFALGITQAQYSRLQEKNSPFANRALTGQMPPGSTFKPFTALMALAENIFDPAESWDTPQKWQASSGWGNHYVTRVGRPAGAVNLRRAMVYSDNVYFAALSVKLGADKFTRHAKLLGFEETIPFPLTVHSSKINTKPLSDVLLADSGYGQGELQMSPLHLALMFSLFPRGDGTIPKPQFFLGELPQTWLDTGYAPENIRLVDETLRAAIQEPGAVAGAGNLEGLDIKGKTGTAEISGQRQLGWYACYFDHYVIVVALDGDTTMNSRQAIDIANQIIRLGEF
ncbi:MAG TPA: penicillin-binding transpeptidase domain-containing protein [Oscillospiraceae bacterium]|nr:penicillin-binding transpeptidase domain-containing protein [Oscillospiraceae bacterium]